MCQSSWTIVTVAETSNIPTPMRAALAKAPSASHAPGRLPDDPGSIEEGVIENTLIAPPKPDAVCLTQV